MVLELATFQVDDVVLGSETRLVQRVLSIDAEELRTILLEDDEFEDVGIDIARPGEDVRRFLKWVRNLSSEKNHSNPDSLASCLSSFRAWVN